jgi:phosphoglycerate dehydrogenase-like enzyme
VSDPSPVAVTSRSFSRHPVLRAETLQRYPNARFNDEGLSLAGDELVAFLDGARRAITALERIDDTVLERLPELEVISKVGVGLDMLDLDALERRGVRLGWAAGTNSRSVSELVLALVLALSRNVVVLDREVRDGGWRQLKGRTLSGRTVGIVGFGHVGRDLAALVAAFGCRVLTHDVRALSDLPAHVEQVELDDLLARADIVSLHAAVTPETSGLISAERLATMKPNALLVNTARGELVDQEALEDALRGGRLGGAALDVFASEPPAGGGLLELDNVVVTPHIGGSTEEAIVAMGRAAIDGLATAVPIADLRPRLSA